MESQQAAVTAKLGLSRQLITASQNHIWLRNIFKPHENHGSLQFMTFPWARFYNLFTCALTTGMHQASASSIAELHRVMLDLSAPRALNHCQRGLLMAALISIPAFVVEMTGNRQIFRQNFKNSLT